MLPYVAYIAFPECFSKNSNCREGSFNLQRHKRQLLPFTFTLKEHVCEFPLLSVAVKTIMWVPSENRCDVSVGKISAGVTLMLGI